MAGRGGNRPRLLLIILLVTSLFLITLDLRGISITKGSRNATQSFLAPIQRGFSDLFSPVGNFISDIKNFGKVKAENQDLLAANEKLKAQVVVDKDVRGQLDKLKGAEKELSEFKVASAKEKAAELLSKKITIGSTQVIVSEFISGLSTDALREISLDLRNQIGDGIIVLASKGDERATIVAAIGKAARDKGVKAGALMKLGSGELGGGGGGKDDFAQGGGTNVSEIPNALMAIEKALTN